MPVTTGNCLNFGSPKDQGENPCTGAPPGYQESVTLAGPIPDNGAAVGYLHAETDTYLGGTSYAVIEVIDNNKLVQECRVGEPKSEERSCTKDEVSSVKVSPGDNLEVRVTAPGATNSGKNRRWRVSFRY